MKNSGCLSLSYECILGGLFASYGVCVQQSSNSGALLLSLDQFCWGLPVSLVQFQPGNILIFCTFTYNGV